MVRQVWAGGIVLLLLEHRVLRLSLSTIALVNAYADVFTATDTHNYRQIQFQRERELASAGDAQTRV